MEPPIRHIPDHLLDRYTMNGCVQVLDSYCDDSRMEPLVYSDEEINKRLAQVAAGELGHYRGIDTWVYEALTRHPIDNLRVSIMGSADQGFGPWYECVCLHFGGQPITIEYNSIQFQDSRFVALTPDEYAENPQTFDAAFSISSFEHDGLGRYGDPMNPDGDLEAMQRMKSMLKPGGVLYLSVPLGVDKVVFNEHRIYGRLRLPRLLEGWTMIDSVGYDEAFLDRDTGYGWEPRRGFVNGEYTSDELLHPEYPEYGPILILRND